MTISIILGLVIAGLIIGSLLSFIVQRYPLVLQSQWRTQCLEFLEQPQEEEVVGFLKPRSCCSECKAAVPFWQYLPLVGYILSSGRCLQCKARMTAQPPIIELFTAFVTVVIVHQFGFTYVTGATLFFSYILIVLGFIDFNTQLLPDDLTLTVMWIGLIINVFSVFAPLVSAVLGAVIAYGFLWVCAKLYYVIRKIEGMGHGDFKMAAMVGAWLGAYDLVNVLVVTVVLSMVVGLLLIFSRKVDFHHGVPYGPFIAIAAWITLVKGPFVYNYLMAFPR